MKKPIRCALGSLGAAALLIAGGFALAIPAQASTPAPVPATRSSVDNGGASDAETADDVTSVEDGTNDGETADDTAAATPGE